MENFAGVVLSKLQQMTFFGFTFPTFSHASLGKPPSLILPMGMFGRDVSLYLKGELGGDLERHD